MGGFDELLVKFLYVEVCTTCISYDDPNVVETYILVFVKALFFGESLDTSLAYTNILIEKTFPIPKQFTKCLSIHLMYFTERDLSIPCSMIVVMPYILVRLSLEE